jgi:hypothetical protein
VFHWKVSGLETSCSDANHIAHCWSHGSAEPPSLEAMQHSCSLSQEVDSDVPGHAPIEREGALGANATISMKLAIRPGDHTLNH